MDLGKNSLASTKTKEQLLYEYKEIKPNPYRTIFGVPIFVVILPLLENYFPELGNNKFTVWMLLGFYLLVEIILHQHRIEKKINLLYEIEKNRVNET